MSEILGEPVEIKSDQIDLINLLPIGIVQLSLTGKVLKINKMATELLGIKGEMRQLENESITDHIDDIKLLNQFWYYLNHGWGKMEFSNLPINGHFLNINGALHDTFYVIDILNVTRTTKALDKATQSLLIGQETEKRRIAREIHDSIGQAISTVKMHLDYTLGQTQNSAVSRELIRISEMVSDISADLRNLSHDLMPGSLVDFGLVTATLQLIKRINQSQQVNVFFNKSIADRDVSVDYELNIYRIIQELVNNALKHSQCKIIQIDLHLKRNNIILEVADDGVGSELPSEPNGIGLHNIKNRLASIKGKMSIHTSPREGFKAKITIPYKSKI